ncbi:MAG: hypothetical protein ACR2NP_11755 [Pirellulaceae bacterium]
MSARDGQGFGDLLEMLDREGTFGLRILELDYDIYAEGAAELGWLNCSFLATSDEPFSLDNLLVGIVESLRTSTHTSVWKLRAVIHRQ